MSAFLAMTAEAIRSGSERGRAIATPDQRLRVFVSSTLEELADERRAARDAIQAMRLTPVMFELGARPHAPQNLYRAYLDQSDVFVGIYWQRYGWVGPGMTISGLEEEYRLAGDKPRLLYLKAPAPAREERLATLIAQIERRLRVIPDLHDCAGAEGAHRRGSRRAADGALRLWRLGSRRSYGDQPARGGRQLRRPGARAG